MTIDHKILYDTEGISFDYAMRDYLDPAEKTLIEEMGKNLSCMDMLDMGVGGGRTTKYFAPLVKSYMGADYAPLMIKACKKKYGKGFNFTECDVRDMKEIAAERFDFILFSYNGIDSFPHKDRLKALKEIRRVLKDGGIFFFSSHNLDWNGLGSIFSLKGITKNDNWKSSRPRRKKAYSFLIQLRLRYLNRSFSMKRRIKKLREKQSGHIYDNSLHGKAGIYYITVGEQIKQLRDAGFEKIYTYSSQGLKTADKNILNKGGWVYYLCS